MKLRFRLREGSYAVAQLAPDEPIPAWATEASTFVSITRTSEELSIVCAEEAVPAGVRAERGWACLELAGPFPFDLTGILHGFLGPLAGAGIPIFALSTYNTDWVLVPAAKLEAALRALEAACHHRE